MPDITPFQGTLIAVDTARNSGFSVWWNGHCVTSGEIDLHKRPNEPFHLIENIGRNFDGVDLLVLEKPFFARGSAGLLASSQGGEVGTWRNAWLRNGLTITRIVQVSPSTWRKILKPHGYKGGMNRDKAREIEQKLARSVTGSASCGTDQAAAICIGYWSLFDDRTKAKERRRKRGQQNAV